MPRAYCSDPVCVPSRFSMFTGRMPSAIGMRGNGGSRLHPFAPEHERGSLGHLLRERSVDRAHLRIRLLEGDAIPQARDGIRAAAATGRPHLLQRLRVGHVEVRDLAEHGI